MDLFFDSEFRSLIPPLTPEERQGLEESLKREGNRDPIVIWKEKNLVIDGHNRYDLCTKYGITLKPALALNFPDRDTAKIWILDNQLSRRNLPISTRLELNIMKFDLIEKGKAKERQATSTGGANPQLRQSFVQAENVPDERKVDALIGEKAGVSRETVRKYRKVREKATTEQKARLKKGNATINQIYVQLRREEVKENIKKIEWPAGKYRVIYADPPWQYSNNMPDTVTAPTDYYQVMPLDTICKLPIRDLALDNSVLFLWTTSPILEESFQVINAWGFKYKASFIWDKIRKNMGHYNSVCHEFLLIAVRGSCQPDESKLFDSVQSVERTEHSAKPEVFREIIDTLYPYGPRIELFARTKHEGWTSWGNQVG